MIKASVRILRLTETAVHTWMTTLFSTLMLVKTTVTLLTLLYDFIPTKSSVALLKKKLLFMKVSKDKIRFMKTYDF